ncbi:hypothetical protein UlMin_038140 [Ulmus minor]
MGFRDLRLFNRALLAKQVWRIHYSPTSLVSRVLQGLYFHKSSFLEAKVNSSSSFVWRSIVWGRGLYMQGSRRKIVLGKFDKVSSLITASGSWDSNLIRASFHPDEAEAILSLPLPRRKILDSFLWHYDKFGHYTVRSGYWLATKRKSAPSSSTSSHTSWWKRFWRLRIPPKIRIFLWKAYYNWIPLLVNLAKHGVPTQKRCPNYNETDDTTLHPLWGCKTLESLKVLCDSFIRFKLPP